MQIPESTLNLILAVIMGFLGGLLTIPINALVSGRLKRTAQAWQDRLDLILEMQELLLEHKLEQQRMEPQASLRSDDLARLVQEIEMLKLALTEQEDRVKR